MPTRGTCSHPDCRRPILWAITENGRRMPLDADPDEAGNAAGYVDAAGTLRVRVLKAGERPETYERRYLPHFASCPGVPRRSPPEGPVAAPAPLPPGVVSLDAYRAARGRTGPR